MMLKTFSYCAVGHSSKSGAFATNGRADFSTDFSTYRRNRMSYNVTPRKLWEWGVINDEQLWRATTAAERDEIVIDLVNEGSLSVYDEEYARYYEDEVQHGPTRFDP